ncbi:MAG: hypothetical protein HKN59_04880, partial [Gammaproteobacteria bacterium]|nr:hypothetical protein [Gammaproteobacteria bacterium]
RVSKLGSNTTTIRYVAGLYEKAESGGVTTHRHFIYADGKTIAVHERYSNANPDTTNYLHRDYQGSVDVITNSSGTELERFSYDAFGKRRFDDWTALCATIPVMVCMATATFQTAPTPATRV